MAELNALTVAQQLQAAAAAAAAARLAARQAAEAIAKERQAKPVPATPPQGGQP